MQRISFVFVLLLLLLMGCQQKSRTEVEFYQWLHDPANGLVKTHTSNNVQLTVKYLPPEWLAYKEAKGINGKERKAALDSLLPLYEHSFAFLLTISPVQSGQASGDIMYKGLESFQGYQERVHRMNFTLDAYISLHTGQKAVKPVLHTLENTYSAVEKRSIYLVFPASETSKEQFGKALDLVFNDPFFETGITHFVFQKDDLTHVPSILF